MLALEKFSFKELENNRELIIQEFQKLFEDGTQFRYAIDSATNNPGPLSERIKILQDIVEKVINNKK